jgi:hypothetical protein
MANQTKKNPPKRGSMAGLFGVLGVWFWSFASGDDQGFLWNNGLREAVVVPVRFCF